MSDQGEENPSSEFDPAEVEIPLQNKEMRPDTAPAMLETTANDFFDADSLGESALQTMTEKAVQIFREGRQAEALDLAVQFSMTSRNQLGRTHPVYINALATVAAIVDQMGGSEEADALLLEAEDLQDEMEMEALGINLNDLDGSAEEDEPSTRPPSHDAGGGPAGRIGSKDSHLTELYSDDDDWTGANSEGNTSDADGDSEPCSGDDRGLLDDDDDGAEAEAEAITRLTFEVNTLLQHDSPEEAAKLLNEAEHIFVAGGGELGPVSKAALHTLWAAVLHSIGEDEKAQCLYDEAIHVLHTEAGPGFIESQSTSEGSSESGEEGIEGEEEEEEQEEEEKDSAKSCSDDGYDAEKYWRELKEDVGDEAAQGDKALRNTDETKPGNGEESTQDANEKNLDAAQPAVETESGSLSFFATEPNLEQSRPVADITATDILIASKRAARLREEMGYTENTKTADDAARCLAMAPQIRSENDDSERSIREEDQRAPVSSPQAPTQQSHRPCSSEFGDEAACQSTSDATFAAQQTLASPHDGTSAPKEIQSSPRSSNASLDVKVPQPPSASSPKKRRPPPLAPQPSYTQPATKAMPKPGAKAAARCGGGFSGLPKQPHRPKAGAAKSKAKAKAKALREEQELPEAANDSEVVESAAPCQEPAVLPAPETAEMPVEEKSPMIVQKPFCELSPDEQLEKVQGAMTCADHFLGLCKFEKAADKLEEMLVSLEEEACSHRHSSLHVDVMTKYGAVLWWDGDPESAIDAYTAAEEILIEKPRDDWQMKRRTEIWTQAAQICRGCGDLDSADEQLSQAVHCLRDLVEKSQSQNLEYSDSLKEAQAALAQVCVEKKCFERAEELYLAAFGTDGGKDHSEGHAESCRPKVDYSAETPRSETAASEEETDLSTK